MLKRLCLVLFILGLAGCQGYQARQRDVTPEYGEESQRLTRLGNESIDDGDLETAERYIAQLRERGYIGAWELQARIHTARDENDKAIKVLDQGLSMDSDDWVLWLQRGNVLSDLKRWGESADSYARARKLDGVSSDIDYNEGLMLLRQERYDEALPLFQSAASVADAAYKNQAVGYSAGCLASLGRVDEVPSLLKPHTSEAQSQGWVEVANFYIRAGKKPKAREAALRAARLDRENSESLWCLRELNLQRSEKAHLWTMFVSGTEGGREFSTGYRVVAETSDQALHYAREIEAPSLKIDSIDKATKGPANKNPMGVYERIELVY